MASYAEHFRSISFIHASIWTMPLAVKHDLHCLMTQPVQHQRHKMRIIAKNASQSCWCWAEHLPEAQCWSGSEPRFPHLGPQAHMSHTPLLGPQWGQWRTAQLVVVAKPAARCVTTCYGSSSLISQVVDIINRERRCIVCARNVSCNRWSVIMLYSLFCCLQGGNMSWDAVKASEIINM